MSDDENSINTSIHSEFDYSIQRNLARDYDNSDNSETNSTISEDSINHDDAEGTDDAEGDGDYEYFENDGYNSDSDNSFALSDAIYDIAEYMDNYPVTIVDKKYVIGWTNVCDVSNLLLLGDTIGINVFYQHTYKNIVDYFYNYSYIEPDNYPQIEIIQVNIIQENIIQDGVYDIYTAVTKTFWLRIIQRKWKKIYMERKRVISCRKNLNTMRTIELFGKYPKYCSYLPTIHGLMTQCQ